MVDSIKRQILSFRSDISNFEKKCQGEDVISVIGVIKEKIKEMTQKYFEADSVTLQDQLRVYLVRCYNLLYSYQAKAYGLSRAYILDDGLEKLPNIYMVNQLPERFEIDRNLLNGINVSEGLSMEQAFELLKCTVNNSRDNLIAEGMSGTGVACDVYGNSSLDGACGFSQYSTLYPLEKLGLEVTVNNIGNVCKERHAYGSVVIPIKENDKIIKKRFLVDCTYRQFFTLPQNVAARYLSHSPMAGFFVSLDEEQIKFAKELLKNGFVLASVDNMEKYLKPFMYSSMSVDDIHEINNKFSEKDIQRILEEQQEEYDYTEEEFIEWGFNLDLMSQGGKLL